MPLIYLSTMCEQPRTKDFVLLGNFQHKLIEPCYKLFGFYMCIVSGSSLNLIIILNDNYLEFHSTVE